MKYRFIAVALSLAALVLSAGPSIAANAQAPAPMPAASATKASPKNTAAAQKVTEAKKKTAAKRKAAAKTNQVDINSASREELMKLPGISEAEATKIIAARPYGSKSWLLTHKVLPADKYQGISDLVAAKNAGSYTYKK